MDRASLDDAIAEAPQEPGVYLFKDGERVLYIGKAIDIQERLRSYRDPRTPRIGRMVEQADRIETRTTEDGRTALLKEANLIKRYQPRYNTRLKDGKSYPVIELTDHRFPQIRASRDPAAKSTVFGPFTSMQTVETAIQAFRDLYGLRACSDHTLETRDRPCVAYQMGLCSAPCAGLISEDEYADRVKTVEGFFRDDPEPVLDEIADRMQEAASEQRFERAATLRDYREALQALLDGQQNRDAGVVHAISVGPDRKRVGLATVEDGQITEKTAHRLTGEPAEDRAAIASFLEQYYARHTLPDRIVVPELPDDALIEDWLAAEDTDLTAPEDGRDQVLIDAARSAVGRQDDSISFGSAFDGKIERIECFDISHTGGTDVVGSNVVFVDGEPATGDYRRKLLEEENDDPVNMARLLRWRAKRHLEGRDDRPAPDLLVIDGGLEQLRKARQTLRRLEWDVPVLAIAEPDDRIIGEDGTTMDLPDEAYQLVRQIRDEAHRFARKSHTQRRDTPSSQLETIEGIGPALRQQILRQIGMEELQEASVEELCQIDGIGRKRANKIRKALNEQA